MGGRAAPAVNRDVVGHAWYLVGHVAAQRQAELGTHGVGSNGQSKVRTWLHSSSRRANGLSTAMP